MNNIMTTSLFQLDDNSSAHSQMNTTWPMEVTTIPQEVTTTMADHLHYAMSAIVGPIICFLGMTGNILSIITWSRPGMSSSTGRYLIGQAVADFGVLLMFILVDSLQSWAPSVKFSLIYGGFFSYIGYPFLFLAVLCSVWITVGVTIDRYIMVCWITKSKELCSESRANIGLILITVNAFLINIPHFASFTLVYPDDVGNSTKVAEPKAAFASTEFGSGSGGQIYEFWIHCIILILIPWVTVFTMNIMIIKKISKSNKRMENKKTRDSMKKCKASEAQITRLLLVVTFSFLIFIGFQCIVQCFWMQMPVWADKEMVSSAFAFAKTGIVFNSSLNFVFYCLTGRRFRVELMKVFGCLKKDFKLSSFRDNSLSGTGSSGKKFSSTTNSTGSTGI
uniref:G-protein coupled receptors family 1 profile domain-containing protein n=1 Tax=Arion vulgaris TaxID=1028688 RepID=A0A0B6Z4T9_9EUPU